MESEGPYRTLMTDQRHRPLPDARVPQANGRVAASGGNAAAVIADAHGFNATTVTLDAMKQLPALSAPDQHMAGRRAGNEIVRRGGETGDNVTPIADPRRQPAGHAVPDMYWTALSCREDGQIVSIDRKRCQIRVGSILIDRHCRLRRSEIPAADRSLPIAGNQRAPIAAQAGGHERRPMPRPQGHLPRRVQIPVPQSEGCRRPQSEWGEWDEKPGL